MSFYYLDPGIKSVVPSAKIKEAQTASDSNAYRPGDIVEAWDHVFRWDKDCVPLSTMEEWRFRGDTLADAALPALAGTLGDSGGTDLAARLDAAVQSQSAPIEVTALWAQLGSIDETSFRYDRAQIARGQAVFHRYAPQILASLLQFSLAGGFSSLRISRVLNLASYLVPPMNSTPEGDSPRITEASNDRTYRRLMETTQFVVDCMGADAMEVGGVGWTAAIRVRLLHATMRKRLLERVRGEMSKMTDPPYVEARDGIPISQEDYTATLSSFSSAVLVNLMKVGITPTLQECEDYIALWKVIGYYIGIDEDILQAHMSSWHQSSRLFASAVVSVFAGESDPPPAVHFPFNKALVSKQDRVTRIRHTSNNADPWTSPATLPVLFSVVNRWPSPFNFLDHCAASRNLIGPTLADWLSIPKTGIFNRLQLGVGFAIVNIPGTFAQYYRSGWDKRRRAAMERSIQAAVYLSLGSRNTKFRPRGPGDFEPRREADEFGSFPSRTVMLATLDWTLLYAEMAAVVLAVSPLMPLYGLWKLSRYILGDDDLPLFASSRVLLPAGAK